MSGTDAFLSRLVARLVFRNDGSLTWFGWICAVGGAIFAAACVTLLGGCVNISTRVLGNDTIKEVYQSTKTAAGFSYVLMFPQVMTPGGGEHFMWENLFSIPIGLVGFVDTACEAAIDTVCLPVDWPLSAYRKNKEEEPCQNQE